MGRKNYWEGNINDDFVPGELLVVMDKSISDPNKVHNPEFFVGVEVVQIIDLSFNKDSENSQFNQILMLILSEKYNTKEATFEALRILESIVGIRSVTPNLIMTPLLCPNDPYYSLSDDASDQWAIDNINVPLVWDFTTGSDLVRVGVVDTGVSPHGDLDDNYSVLDAWTFYNYDGLLPTACVKINDSSHGTHVAGIIGAVGNNEIGITGVNFNFL